MIGDKPKPWLVGGVVAALALAAPAPLMAAAGDVHRVTAERANLRAGPSDAANVRTQVESGTELLELRSERGWVGVRVMETGEEGWIFGDLVERVTETMLDRERADAGFQQLSGDFDRLVHALNDELGYPLVGEVQPTGDGGLAVTLTREWLHYGGRDAHMMAALALYQMWKNHQDQRPVQVTLLDPQGADYITVIDGDAGPSLSLRRPTDE